MEPPGWATDGTTRDPNPPDIPPEGRYAMEEHPGGDAGPGARGGAVLCEPGQSARALATGGTQLRRSTEVSIRMWDPAFRRLAKKNASS